MDKLMLGYARVEFSPDGPVDISGGGVKANSVYEPIYVTAASFRQGDTRVLVVGVDLRNVNKNFLDITIPMITEATGVPKEAIYFHATHNHSAPDVQLYWLDSVKDWRDRIGIPAMVKAAVDAVADEKPITGMSGGETVTENISYVRRYRCEDGTWKGIDSQNPTKAPIVAHETTADPSLRAVRIGREGGKDVIFVNFQTHAAQAYGQRRNTINADFVGHLRDKLEADTGCLMMYVQGGCGNTNYFTKVEAEKELMVLDYQKVGKNLADYAQEALKNGKPMKLGKLQYRYGGVPCSVKHDKDHLCDAIDNILDNEPDQEKQRHMLLELGLGSRHEVGPVFKRMRWGETEPVEIAAVSIGDFAIAFAPFELFDSVARDFRAASPYEMTFYSGYALDYMGYVPGQEVWNHGEYEVYMCHFHSGVGERTVLAQLGYLQDMKKS